MQVRGFGSILVAFAMLACGEDRSDPIPEAEPPVAAPSQATDPDAALDAALRRGIAENGCKILVGKANWRRREDGRFPATIEELLKAKGPLDIPDVSGGDVIDESLQADPWDKPYVYEVLEDHVRVTSAGPDGERGTADDISSTGQ